jgi:formylglycine-generating enzyme required for sulfatase activity
MKHEVPHHAYVDFLNCLTRDQQNARTSVNLKDGITTVEFVFVMVYNSVSPRYSALPKYRSSIRCDTIIPEHGPITFYCDLNNNTIRNEEDDGQHIACVYPSWNDAMAYLDWSGLRPMTELEFEKSCRGPLYPVAKEYVWGTNEKDTSSILNNAGTAYETSSSATANCTAQNAPKSPTRVGMYAKPGNSREQSGATYYGILDMGGNLWERPVTVGNLNGRNYTGQHGDGILTSDGNADVDKWPHYTPEMTEQETLDMGSGYRGGYFESNVINGTILCIANRQYAAQGSNPRKERYGIRGIRTAP